MSKILVIGNIIKDNYIRIADRCPHVLRDQNDTPHLDLAFDGSSHAFHSDFSVFGGAAVTIDTLRSLGVQPHFPLAETNSLSDENFDFSSTFSDRRHIICYAEDVAYLCPDNFTPSSWQNPQTSVDAVYVDRSACMTAELSLQVSAYLESNPNTKLYLFISDRNNQYDDYVKSLIRRADFLISDTKLIDRDPDLFISANQIIYRGLKTAWSLRKKQQLLTHLTTHLIIAATIISAHELGLDPRQSILLARANIEHATLSNTSTKQQLEAIIQGQEYQVESITEGNDMNELQQNAKRLVASPKGILAADESGGSINKKFSSMGIEDNEQNRRDYRNLFFTTPSLEEYVNGVILFDETARQFADNGDTFVEFLSKKGIIPGVKVDQGLENLPNSEEKYTKGLESLLERLKEYYQMGARFAKWRAAFELTDTTPSDLVIAKNAQILAQYASDCQAANIVPIVEPELIYDGNYSIEKSIYATSKILDHLFIELIAKKVDLSACILKVNMVLAGKKYHTQSTPQEVGEATAKVLRDHVPAELAGVVFLSGGQSVEQATDNLQAVTNQGPFPWPVTFSFARALQDPALFAWRGNNQNADPAREAFRLRLVANTRALVKQ